MKPNKGQIKITYTELHPIFDPVSYHVWYRLYPIFDFFKGKIFYDMYGAFIQG